MTAVAELDNIKEERPYRSRYGFWLRTVSLAVIVAFLAQDVVSAQGGTPVWSHVTKSEDPQKKDGSQLNNITIPYDAGLTRKVVANGTGDVIINIQDAHSKLGAQESITKILDNLVKNYDLSLIALEGASDKVDTSLVSTFPVEEAKKTAGRYLLKEGHISASEFYSMITEKPVSLYGVEDPELYKENLAAFKDLIEKKQAIRQELRGLKKAVGELESRIYSADLLELSKNRLLQKNGDIRFSEYWDYFSKMAKRHGVDYEKYPNLKKLAATMDLEGEIDFRKANTERDALINELGKKLPKSELEKLVLQALQYKQNKMTPGAFHYYLAQIAQGIELDPLAYKNIILYSQYVVHYESIDLIAIFDEVEGFENGLKEKMFQNGDERLLSNLAHCVSIFSQLLDTSLTSKDHKFYLANADACEIRGLRSAMRTLGEKYKVSHEAAVDFDKLEAAVPSARKFYELAEKRNRVMLENTMRRMRQEKTRVAALVTGGFHSEGIAELMDQEKLSYLVVMPKFDDQSPDRPYIAILTQKPKEYEEAFKDSDFYIAAASLFDLGQTLDKKPVYSPEQRVAVMKQAVASLLVSTGVVTRSREITAEFKATFVEAYRAKYEKNGKRATVDPETLAGWLKDATLVRDRQKDAVRIGNEVYRVSFADREQKKIASIEVSGVEREVKVAIGEIRPVVERFIETVAVPAAPAAKVMSDEEAVALLLEKARKQGWKTVDAKHVRQLGLQGPQADQVLKLAGSRLAAKTPKPAVPAPAVSRRGFLGMMAGAAAIAVAPKVLEAKARRAADLLTDLQTSGMTPAFNRLFGTTLPASGAASALDQAVIDGLINTPGFNQANFLADLPEADSLYAQLRAPANNQLRLNFNTFYQADVRPSSVPNAIPDPITREALFTVVGNPTYNEGAFLNGLVATPNLLNQLQTFGYTDEFNRLYGTNLPTTGTITSANPDFAVLQSVTGDPNFNAAEYLRVLPLADSLHTALQGNNTQRVNFNNFYGANVQPTGPPTDNITRQALFNVAGSPTYNQTNFLNGLVTTPNLLNQLQTANLIPQFNRLYGTNLPLSGTITSANPDFAVLQSVTGDPNFDAANFLAVLPWAEALFTALQDPANSQERASFNQFYGVTIPSSGNLQRPPLNNAERKALFDIAGSPTYNQANFLSGLIANPTLLNQLQTAGLVDEFNRVFGTNLPATGTITSSHPDWPVLAAVTGDPNYNPSSFLAVLPLAEGLFTALQDPANSQQLANFNQFYGVTIPATGNLRKSPLDNSERNALFSITGGVTYNQTAFMNGLIATPTLLSQLQSLNLVDEFNRLFGTNLPTTGTITSSHPDWPVLSAVTGDPNYDPSSFLAALPLAESLFTALQDPANSQQRANFNQFYGVTIPATGNLRKPPLDNSERKALFDIAGSPTYNQGNFLNGLIATPTLLNQLQTAGLIDEFNRMFGTNLPVTGTITSGHPDYPVLAGLTGTPGFDPAGFLGVLPFAEALFTALQDPANSQQLANFNQFYGVTIPAFGNLRKSPLDDAEREALFSIAGNPNYDQGAFLNGLLATPELLSQLQALSLTDEFDHMYGTTLPTTGTIPASDPDWPVLAGVTGTPGFDAALYLSVLPFADALLVALQDPANDQQRVNFNTFYGANVQPGQTPDPTTRRILFEITGSPNYSHTAFMNVLLATPSLLNQLQGFGLTDEFNYLYGTLLPASGTNVRPQDLAVLNGVTGTPGFDAANYLNVLPLTYALLVTLQDGANTTQRNNFNTFYRPANAGPTFGVFPGQAPDGETLAVLFSIAGTPNFNLQDFLNGLITTPDLLNQLQSLGLTDEFNFLFANDIAAVGGLPLPATGPLSGPGATETWGILMGITGSKDLITNQPNFNAAVFLGALTDISLFYQSQTVLDQLNTLWGNFEIRDALGNVISVPLTQGVPPIQKQRDFLFGIAGDLAFVFSVFITELGEAYNLLLALQSDSGRRGRFESRYGVQIPAAGPLPLSPPDARDKIFGVVGTDGYDQKDFLRGLDIPQTREELKRCGAIGVEPVLAYVLYRAMRKGMEQGETFVDWLKRQRPAPAEPLAPPAPTEPPKPTEPPVRPEGARMALSIISPGLEKLYKGKKAEAREKERLFNDALEAAGITEHSVVQVVLGDLQKKLQRGSIKTGPDFDARVRELISIINTAGEFKVDPAGKTVNQIVTQTDSAINRAHQKVIRGALRQGVPAGNLTDLAPGVITINTQADPVEIRVQKGSDFKKISADVKTLIKEFRRVKNMVRAAFSAGVDLDALKGISSRTMEVSLGRKKIFGVEQDAALATFKPGADPKELLASASELRINKMREAALLAGLTEAEIAGKSAAEIKELTQKRLREKEIEAAKKEGAAVARGEAARVLEAARAEAQRAAEAERVALDEAAREREAKIASEKEAARQKALADAVRNIMHRSALVRKISEETKGARLASIPELRVALKEMRDELGKAEGSKKIVFDMTAPDVDKTKKDYDPARAQQAEETRKSAETLIAGIERSIEELNERIADAQDALPIGWNVTEATTVSGKNALHIRPAKSNVIFATAEGERLRSFIIEIEVGHFKEGWLPVKDRPGVFGRRFQIGGHTFAVLVSSDKTVIGIQAVGDPKPKPFIKVDRKGVETPLDETEVDLEPTLAEAIKNTVAQLRPATAPPAAAGPAVVLDPAGGPPVLPTYVTPTAPPPPAPGLEGMKQDLANKKSRRAALQAEREKAVVKEIFLGKNNKLRVLRNASGIIPVGDIQADLESFLENLMPKFKLTEDEKNEIRGLGRQLLAVPDKRDVAAKRRIARQIVQKLPLPPAEVICF
ncbi:MAG: hypothetical protein ACREH5_03350, partial [Candidatus Omnitrophota bacterium]